MMAKPRSRVKRQLLCPAVAAVPEEAAAAVKLALAVMLLQGVAFLMA